MKTVERDEFVRTLTRIPGHLLTVQISNTIEYYFREQLVGVLVKSEPVKRLLPTFDQLKH